MNGVLLDSDVQIELLRGRNALVTSQFESLLSGATPLFCSAVSLAEIGQGAKEGEATSIADLFELLKCLEVDCDIARSAGAILRQFRRSHAIELADGLIAATALKHGLQLWTRNRSIILKRGLCFYRALESMGGLMASKV